MLDYFAARAPATPQPWFEPVMKSARPPDLWRSTVGPKTTFLDSWSAERLVGDDFENANERQQLLWDGEYDKQRKVQWPAAWAKEVLKTLGYSHE